jgi:hypothetical protein
MRLLNTTTSKLEEFEGNKISLYAILSHTWGDNEATFQDIEGADAEKKENKKGYEKIRMACSIVAADGFHYVWIDTCCINKTSSAELSEAINSMYRWYQESGVCYTYLADVSSRAADGEFKKSRWFTRGWTLQELIAPSIVIFLDRKWRQIGTKSRWQSKISEITGIPASILLEGNLECASVAQKMSWASKRKTTRVEDLAYCLIGIFGVNMPMLYGEGESAFLRLQEEIMKVSDDYSIFAWESIDYRGGLLATLLAAFVKSSEIALFNYSNIPSGAITMNKEGIHLKLHFMDRPSFQGVELAILPCTVEGKRVAIHVRAISQKEEYFVRIKSNRLELLNVKDFSQSRYREKSICLRQERLIRKNQLPLPKAAWHGNKVVVKLLLENGADLESKDSEYGRTPLL